MHTLASFLLSTSLLLTACGSDSDLNETLDDIGQAGFDRICDEARSQLRDMYASSLITQFICTAEAVAATTTAEDCAAAVEVCRNNPPQSAIDLSEQILAQAGCGAVSIEPIGCNEPTARLTGCLDALESEIDRLQFTGTCKVAGQPVDPDWWQIQVPAACTSVDSDC